MSSSSRSSSPSRNWARRPSSRSAMRTAWPATSPGRGRSAARAVTRAAGLCLANRARRSSGPVRIRALAWLMVRVRSPAALRRATIRVRIASTAPSRPLGAPRARPGSADRIQGIGLALTAAVLPVGTVHLDDPDASRGDITGQPGTVTACPLDPDQAHRPEPAQPAQQAGIASRGSGELPDAEQAADMIERGSDMGIRVSIHAAGNRGATGNRACFFYDGHSHPFLRLRDGTHPLAVGPVKPWPLIQARQIRPAMPVGARKNWDPADRSFRKTTRCGVSRLGGQAGTQAPDPTLIPPQNRGSRAGSHIHSLPVYSVRGQHRRAADANLNLPSSILSSVVSVSGLNQSLAKPLNSGATAAPATVPPPAGFRNAQPCGAYYGQKIDTADPPYNGQHLPYAPCGYKPGQLRSAYGIAGTVQRGVSG